MSSLEEVSLAELLHLHIFNFHFGRLAQNAFSWIACGSCGLRTGNFVDTCATGSSFWKLDLRTRIDNFVVEYARMVWIRT